MKRLTSPRCNGIKSGYWSPSKKDELVQRLGRYEDTGLEPEEIKPVVHAHWISLEFYECGCSKCHTAHDHESAYCPSCGAKMDEVSENG